MQRVSIFNLSPIDTAERLDGSRAVAAYDTVVAGLRLIGCVIVLTPDRSLVAEPPAAKTRNGRDRVVKIIDPDLDREFQAVALAAFRAITKEAPHVA